MHAGPWCPRSCGLRLFAEISRLSYLSEIQCIKKVLTRCLLYVRAPGRSWEARPFVTSLLSWERRDDLTVSSTFRGIRVQFPTHGSSPLSGTPAPEDSTPSHRHPGRQNTHKIKLKESQSCFLLDASDLGNDNGLWVGEGVSIFPFSGGKAEWGGHIGKLSLCDR